MGCQVCKSAEAPHHHQEIKNAQVLDWWLCDGCEDPEYECDACIKEGKIPLRTSDMELIRNHFWEHHINFIKK